MSPYQLLLTDKGGRIWTGKPAIESDGLVSVFKHPAKGGSFELKLTAVAFSPSAELLATVDNRGNVVVFHINRYKMKGSLAHPTGRFQRLCISDV